MTAPSVTDVHSNATNSTVGPNEDLQAIVDRIAAKVELAEQVWIDELQDGILRPLATLIEELVEAASEAENRLKTESSTRAYRSSVAEDVVGKAGRFLRSNPPEERATRALVSLLDAIASEVATLPAFVVDDQGSDPYAASDSDGWPRRMRKILVRAGRLIQRKRRPRRIPVRRLAAYHLQVRVPRRFVTRHIAYLRRLCTLFSAIEDVFAEWTHAILELEQAGDDPSHYTPGDFVIAAEAGDADSARLDDLRDQVLDVASTLTAGLRRLKPPFALEAPPDLRSNASPLLASDFATAGTFMLPAKDRVLPSDPYLPIALLNQDQQPWISWIACSRNKMRVNWHLLNLKSVLVTQLHGLTDRAASQTVRPLTEVLSLLRDQLQQLRGRLSTAFQATKKESGNASVLREIARIREELDDFVTEITSRGGTFGSASDFLNERGGGEGELVAKAFEQLPGPLRLRISAASPLAIHLGFAEFGEVDLKSIAQRMLSLSYSDQVRGHSDALKLTVTRRWIEIEHAVEVVRFGLTAANEELRADQTGIPGGVDQAEELAIDGFTRAIETTQLDGDDLLTSWGTFVHGVVGVALGNWAVLHRQVLAAEMSEEWTGYGDRIKRNLQGSWVEIKRRSSAWMQKAESVFRLGRRHAHSLIQRGQSVVGVGQVTPGKRLETVDAISGWRGLVQELPLVYRRLYSFEPLTDSSHLVNRSTDLSAVAGHYERWQNGLATNALVLSSPRGSGRSSFINTVERSVFAGADVRRIVFEDRYESEAPVAEKIAAAMGFPTSGEQSFARLEEEFLGLSRGAVPLVCIVDNLEHVLLRVPGGSQLLESLLIFMSRTDQIVYWMASMGTLVHQFLEKTMRIGGFIDFYSLAPFTREATQSMLMTRHRKSGLPLEFRVPHDAGAIMKQRLRRAKSTDEQQEILRGVFFEKLHKDAGQNLRLALFYWLRSIDFGEEGDRMTIGSVKTLNVDFLNDIDLRRAFSLKAVLFHLTLTQEEHNRLFRLSDREGTVVMESLLNMGLIASVGQTASRGRDRIESEVRYEVQPLLVHPITEYLRGRRIVY